MKKVRHYSSFSEDFEKSANQGFEVPDGYRWIRTDFLSCLLSAVLYALAVAFGTVYCRFFLHMRIVGRKKLSSVKGGFFLFGNHTQPLGDVFMPALCTLPKRIYTVAAPANYGIPVIGHLLPFLGALPAVSTVHGIRELSKAIEKRISEGHALVVYPEAHVWEYYTEIRPFPETAFKFPVKTESASFALTATYQKTKLFKRPQMTVYIDGPFYPRGNSVKEKTTDLHDRIFDVMSMRSKSSNCEYIEYVKK